MSSAPTPGASPGMTRDLRLVAHQLVAEQRMFWRSREAAIFIFVFPLLLYSLLSSVYSQEIEFEGRKVPSADVLLAGLFGYGAANTAFAGLAIILVGRRETGILKRLRATPLPPGAYMAAVILSTLIVFALQAVVLLALGAVLFGASAPANALGFAGAILLGVACFAGMGIGAAALIRSADGASAVVNVVLLPMAFLSGSFGPRGDYPEVLQAIADVLPLTYFLDVVNGVYLDGDSFFADPGALGIVAAWGVVGVVVALRRFGWMPRER
jgi:ABC-2 type transport system permease protein